MRLPKMPMRVTVLTILLLAGMASAEAQWRPWSRSSSEVRQSPRQAAAERSRQELDAASREQKAEARGEVAAEQAESVPAARPQPARRPAVSEPAPKPAPAATPAASAAKPKPKPEASAKRSAAVEEEEEPLGDVARRLRQQRRGYPAQ